MKSLIISQEVELEIEISAKYFKLQYDGLEILFLDEIENAFLKIQENPERYPIIEQRIRKFIIQRFPFNIFYEINKDGILILAVAHQKRKPDYWKSIK